MTEPRPLAIPRIEALQPVERVREALDALTPYLVAAVAVGIARAPFSSIAPSRIAAVAASLILAVGAALTFLSARRSAHLTWIMVFVSSVLLLPVVALHVRIESVALNALAPILLLPLAFTWAAMLAIATPLIGGIYVHAAEEPAWAGTVAVLLSLSIGVVPVLSANPSQRAFWNAAMMIYGAAGAAACIARLIPERRRWPVIALTLVVGAVIIGRAFLVTPHHLPGRILFVGDTALAVALGIVALAAPPLCRWLIGNTGKPHLPT